MNRTALGLISGVVVALMLAGVVTLSQAAGPAGMKLYAFSSGGLTIAKSALQSGAPQFRFEAKAGVLIRPTANTGMLTCRLTAANMRSACTPAGCARARVPTAPTRSG